jgi:hypothetical protein
MGNSSVIARIHSCVFAALSAFLAVASLSTNSQADSLAYCNDYFRDAWNVRLDMSEVGDVLEDLPGAHKGTNTAFSYANGKLGFDATGGAPLISILTDSMDGAIPEGTRFGDISPINTAVYDTLNVRMYLPQDAVASVRFWTRVGAEEKLSFVTFPVYAGWHNYSWDMRNASSDWTGLVYGINIYPANLAMSGIQVDWISLNPSAGCSGVTKNFAGTGGAGLRRQLVIDEDTNPGNGYQVASTPSTGNTHSIAGFRVAPGSYQMLGLESGDFATLNFGGLGPWNFSQPTHVLPGLIYNLGSSSFSSSGFSVTSTGGDSSFYVNLFGKTIDPQVFRHLSLGITYDGATNFGNSGGGEIYFFLSNDTFIYVPLTPAAGARVFQSDLSSLIAPGLQIRGIRIDPVNLAGRTLTVNFLSLNSASVVSNLSTIYSATSLGSLTGEDLQLAVSQPDRMGGAEFYQTQRGQAQNMSSTGDFVRLANLSKAEYFFNATTVSPAGDALVGDFFRSENLPPGMTGAGDPIPYSTYNPLQGEIDTNRWKHVCFAGFNDNEDERFNSVARVIWTTMTGGFSGDDIIIARGYRTYCLDMQELVYAQIEPPVNANPWLNKSLNALRVDWNENEFKNGYYTVIDFVHLREDHKANGQFAVVVDAPLNKNVELFFNTTKSTSGGTLITTLASGRQSNTYLWNTSGVPEGAYFIYARVVSAVDGAVSLTRLAEGRLLVARDFSDSTPPVLECERPRPADAPPYVTGSQVELAGYALDETRLASLEVATSSDNATFTYLTRINPTKFHLAARERLKSYAEANNPGFQQLQDISTLPDGPVYIRYTATDTAGNQTYCTHTITKQTGAPTPALLEYPAANGTGVVAQPRDGTTNPAPARPSLSVRRSSRDGIRFTLTSCVGGGTLQAAESTARLRSRPTTVGSITASATAARLPALTPAVKRKRPKIHFQATCSNGTSSTKSLDASSLSSKRTVRSVTQLVATIRASLR